MKIPDTCGDCKHLVSEALCGIYEDRFFCVKGEQPPPPACPKRQVARFEWLCRNCIKKNMSNFTPVGYDISYSLELKLTYNNDVMATIDNEMEPQVEPELPDTGYWHEVNTETGEVVNAGHAYNPIKDMEARMSLKRKGSHYTLLTDDPFYTNKVEIWKGKTKLNHAFLHDGVSVILVRDDTKEVTVYPADQWKRLKDPWRRLFEVTVSRGKIMSWTDFQLPKEPTIEDRVAALEKKLGL